MTTLAQIKELVGPLLARNTDLVRVGQLIAVRPVHHLLRGIFIDRTGDKERCRPRWMATELFSRLDSLPLGLGELLRHPDGLWWISDSSLPRTLA